MPLTFVRAAALLMAAAFVVAACAAPGLSPNAASSRSDQPTAVSEPGGRQPGTTNGAAPAGLDIGQRAPPFVVTGLDGRQVSDLDLRAQGKPYILYFYATW